MISRRAFSSTLVAGAAAMASPLRLAAATPAAAVAPLRIQRLSWAGIRLETPETTLFIDPWTSKAAWGGTWPRPIVPLEASSKRRSVLITHLHNDHFDAAALKLLLAEGGAVFCLDKLAPVVASKGLVARPVELFHPEAFGDFVFIPVSAADGFGETQVSWIVKAAGMNLIHCGDTVWHSGFELDGRAYGPFDVAFLPMNGAVIRGRPIDVDVPATMTPTQAVAAALLLRAKLVVPIHYGVSEDDYREEPNAIEETKQLAAAKGVAVRFVDEGEWVIK
ncbi:MAG: MBL fold metallo-hydrolase [Acidobacteria bacterium]|nr:MBL fold metallo-hydrolase [Acidobacteriota bacterium]MBV9476119.1 MBL fold metallo-hydrolase [Acidobacteriota bacterium]